MLVLELGSCFHRQRPQRSGQELEIWKSASIYVGFLEEDATYINVSIRYMFFPNHHFPSLGGLLILPAA